MGIRFIIRNLNQTDAMTHEAKSGRATVVPVQAARRRRRGQKTSGAEPLRREERKSNRSGRSHGAGKQWLGYVVQTVP